MSSSFSKTLLPADLWRTLAENPRRLIVPAVAITLVVGIYSMIRPATWEATQALVVRDEAGDRASRPGKFTHADEMKTVQETILELARSRGVLTKALSEVGPPADLEAGAAWPNDRAVEALEGSLKVVPPKGAEFGKTEVFYLKVKDHDKERACDMAAAVCKQVQARFADLRRSKAHSTIDELTRSLNVAQEDLNTATASLRKMESKVGSDLAELRMLNEAPSGDSDLRRTAIDLEREVRGFKAAIDEGNQFLSLLNAAEDDPSELLASPSTLTKSQPALGRLKDGLVDAQIRTGVLRGTMQESHPQVQSSLAAQDALYKQLRDEINTAKSGVEVDLRVNKERIVSLERKLAEIQNRLETLATLRAEYANLVTASKHRAETVKAIDHELTEARASQAASSAASVISLLDIPDPGNRPIGPGRTTILLAGMAAGLLLGFAVICLTAQPSGVPAPVVSVPSMSLRVATHEGSSGSPSLTGLTLKQALHRLASEKLNQPTPH